MARLSVLVGLILTLVGFVGYFASGRVSVTALIPAMLGLALVILGRMAKRKPALLKHAMHGAALVALLGVAGTASRAMGVMTILGGGLVERPAAVWSSFVTFVVCLLFLILCILSFIKARRQREA
jgi:hypothetical protein